MSFYIALLKQKGSGMFSALFSVPLRNINLQAYQDTDFELGLSLWSENSRRTGGWAFTVDGKDMFFVPHHITKCFPRSGIVSRPMVKSRSGT